MGKRFTMDRYRALRLVRQNSLDARALAENMQRIERWGNSLDGREAWQTPTFTSPWTHYDLTNWIGARYRRVGDVVEIEGLVRTTANITPPYTIFVLPEDYRPQFALLFAQIGAVASDASARIQVLGSGDVQLVSITGAAWAATVAYLSINCRFSIL